MYKLLIIFLIPFSSLGMHRIALNRSLRTKLPRVLNNKAKVALQRRLKSDSLISKRGSDPLSLKQKHGTFDYKTSTVVPEFARYNNDYIIASMGNYKFEKFEHFYTFYEKNDSNIECISFIDSATPIDVEFSDKNNLITSSIDQEENIQILFNKLPLGLKVKLTKEIAKDLKCYFQKTANVNNYMHIDLLMQQLNPCLQSHYKRIITDLAMKDPKFFINKEFKIKSFFETDYCNDFLIVGVRKFIFFEKSNFKESCDNVMNLISSIPEVIKKALPHSKTEINDETIITQHLPERSPYEVLNVTEDMSLESIKEAYFNLRIQYENNKEMTQALKNAYEKIKEKHN